MRFERYLEEKMDTRELLEAKKVLEKRIHVAINKELDSFHKQTGLPVDEIKIRFAQFEAADGTKGCIFLEKVTCKIFLE
jgi:hypothetical protein